MARAIVRWCSFLICLLACAPTERSLNLDRGLVALLVVNPVTCRVTGDIGTYLERAEVPPEYRREVALTGIVMESAVERQEISRAFGVPVATPVLTRAESADIMGPHDAAMAVALFVDGRRMAMGTVDRIERLRDVMAALIAEVGTPRDGRV